MLDSRSSNLEELAIAVNPGDERRILPEVPQSCRAILDVGGGAGQTLLALGIEGAELLVSLDIDPESLSLGRELSDSIKFVRGRGIYRYPYRQRTILRGHRTDGRYEVKQIFQSEVIE